VGLPVAAALQQTQVELSRGFGAMGKVISRMAVQEPGRSTARTGMTPDEAGDSWETAGAEAKMARPTGRGQTSALRHDPRGSRLAEGGEGYDVSGFRVLAGSPPADASPSIGRRKLDRPGDRFR